MLYCEKTDGRPSLIYLHRMRPLSIIKQIVTMFLSVNERAQLYRSCTELKGFVLNTERRNLPQRCQVFAYFHAPGPNRESEITAQINIEKSGVVTMSEFTYPPFGYVMTLDSPPPDGRLFNTSRSFRYFYYDFEIVELRLPVLPTHGPAPGDDRKFRDFPMNTREPQAFPEQPGMDANLRKVVSEAGKPRLESSTNTSSDG